MGFSATQLFKSFIFIVLSVCILYIVQYRGQVGYSEIFYDMRLISFLLQLTYGLNREGKQI